MIVVHICLANFFVDGRGYQENELVRQHVRDGHTVTVLASTETHDEKGRTVFADPGEYMGDEGARVIRVPYPAWLPNTIARRLRVHVNVRSTLETLNPDVVIFHGLVGFGLLTVVRYAKENPRVILHADCHADYDNSAQGFFGRHLLHGLYHRAIVTRCLPVLGRVLCTTMSVMTFVHEVYGVPRDRLVFFPLAGHPVPDAKYAPTRERVRAELDVEPDHVLFVMSGRLKRRKKLIEALKALGSVPDPRFRLVVAGAFSDDTREEALRLMDQDPRVTFLGWLDADQLTDLLCAADVYLQPGSQSVTMQGSLCARCAIIVDDVPSHEVFHCGNGWLIGGDLRLEEVLREISLNPGQLSSMREASFRFAKRTIDYSKLASELLERSGPVSSPILTA